VNVEKTLTILFVGLGILSGFLSKLFGDLTLSISLPLLIYFIFQVLSFKFIKSRKSRSIFYTGFMAFVLIWLVTWIILYNIR